MTFKKRRGIKLPYDVQGLIHFTCVTYDRQGRRTQEKIRRLCRKIGGEYEAALFDMVTTNNSVLKISMEHHCDETTLYRLRKRFYESW